ncbi:wall-associated receptor kinase-like 20 isoform X2 [Cryptomeria japonica]|uniref:wall-associated receptor kinase-like 20 isoform X2 n=1 Tax=Cryptomeria japonica TaxID=3369 RepID=UPI0027D9CFAB|nr:wall-associated receptor kinase-like 20 isoform X2 [Cryptomeria japonica]
MTTMFTINLLLLFVSLSITGGSAITCPKCGNTSVPYPLSTGDGCGDPYYRVYCNKNKQLEFRALSSTYPILSVDATSNRLVIQPAPLQNNSCTSQDYKSQGILLNNSLPFNITNSNTILLLNCSTRLLLSPLNCTPASLCHQYVEQVEETKICSSSNLCCTFSAGASPSSYRIHVWHRGCRAYTSIVNLNPSLPAREWRQGVEIQWASPPEPACQNSQGCGPNSRCLRDPKLGGKRCLCNRNFHWEPMSGICTKNLSSCQIRGVCRRGLLIGAGAAGALTVIYRRKKQVRDGKSKLAKERTSILSANSGGKAARIFSSKEIKKATNGFSKDRLLGTGGFGEVYKGTLEDGTTVAVKVAKLGNSKSTEQVLNEVRILSQVNHKNLVKLLGCCVEAEQPLMIYEYIPNGTLYDRLHKPKPSNQLNWQTRLNIASQTAQGLAYLHSAAYTPIFHRDVKSTNILLDENMNAKVSDFGLSRLAEPDLSHISTCAQGTLGYLDPEYYRNYQLTDKSDVYSFGVVLLELVTSQKAIDFSRGADDVNLAVYVMERSEEGKIVEIVDPGLLSDSSPLVVDTVKAFACLALGCLQEKSQDRPSMKEVAEELQYIIGLSSSSNEDAHVPDNKQEDNGLILRLNWPY